MSNTPDKHQKEKITPYALSNVSNLPDQDIHISDSYTRKNYVDQQKMRSIKEQAYTTSEGQKQKTMTDPYTGKQLHRDQNAAERKYGKERKTSHTSQTDHTVPLKELYKRNKDSAWLTDDDLKKAANNKHNLKEISTHINEQKGSGTNLDVIKNNSGEMTVAQKTKLVMAQAEGEISTSVLISGSKMKHIGEVGLDGAKGAMIGAAPAIIHQGVQNIVGTLNQEIDASEATANIVDATVNTVTTGAVSNIINHQIEHSANIISEKIIHKTLDPVVIGNISGLVLSLKGCTNRYVTGEISSEEYLLELFEDGIGYLISETAFLIGGSLGGPLAGACCAYVLGEAYNYLIGSIREGRLSKKRCREMNEIAQKIKAEEEAYRKQFMVAFTEYYTQREDQINIAYTKLIEGLTQNNIDLFLTSVNSLGQAFGIQYECDSFSEFDKKMNDSDFIFQF